MVKVVLDPYMAHQLTEKSIAYGIMNRVGNFHAIIVWQKLMVVIPKPVRTGTLLVDEGRKGNNMLHLGDPCDANQRKDAKTVTNDLTVINGVFIT